ncbi:NADH:flavin oxidoreductase/NADH oxidase [Alteromonas aestuariivivens]|uniref:NADH:flavin oxidoreductase/NADH oxidase n=1 Tax=Alteromonas aestuariivivens TaxID=1938339 RepID=A0A3D8MDW0_9ALTE|nr:NADH:flavin oxidoreductase/NADH oxidase [Alteromonas aestuariivivens]RDV28922.1 NADH:flavin oxidoreductase/NADH oxidase [Alteromonas aestuariivivens]
MPALFEPFTLKDVTLRNRIAVPPMCQYQAEDGFVNQWHQANYAGFARGGAGLVIVEATAVSPEGRITPNCVGLWKDEHIEGLSDIAQRIKDQGAVAGIQLAHAGRKASAHRPWDGDDHIAENDPAGWQPIGPSAVPFGAHLPRTPTAMALADIERVKQDFVAAAQRARKAGYEWLELHFAHGYLAQSFFSRHANQRSDQYGGDFEGRSRFLLETLAAVREVWPDNLPLTVRFGVIEYDGDDEQTLSESIELIKRFKQQGADFVSVSVGFNIPDASIPWGPAFLAPIAERVKKEAQIPVATAWGVDTPELANQTVENGQLDVVMVGRMHLTNPHWAYYAAQKLGKEEPSSVLPASYAHWLQRYAPSDAR